MIEALNGKSRLFLLRIFYYYYFGPSSRNAVILYRFSEYFYLKKFYWISTQLRYKLERRFGVYIGARTIIGTGLKMPHPNGIIIGEGVIIGHNATIYQQVTLGGSRIGDAKENSYPILGDNCVLFSGAKLVGKIRIGCNCVIGANAVVLKDVPDNKTAVGIPAKWI